jgi:hypothetical protein
MGLRLSQINGKSFTDVQSHPVTGLSRDDCGDAYFSTVLYALLDVQQSRLSEMHTYDALWLQCLALGGQMT